MEEKENATKVDGGSGVDLSEFEPDQPIEQPEKVEDVKSSPSAQSVNDEPERGSSEISVLYSPHFSSISPHDLAAKDEDVEEDKAVPGQDIGLTSSGSHEPPKQEEENLARVKSRDKEINDWFHKHPDDNEDIESGVKKDEYYSDLTASESEDYVFVHDEDVQEEIGLGSAKRTSAKQRAKKEKKSKDIERGSNDSAQPDHIKRKATDAPTKSSDFTHYNRHILKWAVIFIGVWNFVTGMFICWQYVMNHALQEYLLSINSINCPSSGNDDWIPIWTNIICCFASILLLFAENEESADICIFWAVVKLVTCLTFFYVRIMKIMIVPDIDWAFEIAWITVTTLIDFVCLVIVIMQYYRLTNNKPVMQRLNKARGKSYLNREIWFAGEQEFFRSKHAYRWVCRNQSLKIVEKIQKLRRHYKRPNKNYKFSAEDYTVDYRQGYRDYRRSYNIKTDIFNGVNRLDFGRYGDDEDLIRAVDDVKPQTPLTTKPSDLVAYLYF